MRTIPKLLCQFIITTLIPVTCYSATNNINEPILNTEKTMTPQISSVKNFDTIFEARNLEFENLRIELFQDKNAVDGLVKFRNDPDKVRAFVARVLYHWASNHPEEYAKAEKFIETGIYSNQKEKNRTIKGWQGADEIFNFLSENTDKNTHEYMLLQALMRPSRPYIWTGVNDYAFSAPCNEPEVLIRSRVGLKNESTGFYGVADKILPQLGEERALEALIHERNYFKKSNIVFPAELEEVYRKLLEWKRSPQNFPQRKWDGFYKVWRWGWENWESEKPESF